MSAKNSKLWAERSQGMKGMLGMHVGTVQCYRSKARHAKFRWGKKKGTRRARRRLDKEVIERDLNE